MQKLYSGKGGCCGCAACAYVCPRRAIEMCADGEGFLYPVVDDAACADCGKCVSVCPVKKAHSLKSGDTPRFYAARHKSGSVLEASTSGGMFTAVSDVVLERGGVIYGVVFDHAMRIIHARAATARERDCMRVSKYAQTNIHKIYKQLIIDLEANREVLFTGTPCQCAAVKAAVSVRLHTRLTLCDVVCHSVPSPRVWDDYRTMLEQENGGRIVGAAFRTKLRDWTREQSNRGFLYYLDGDGTPRSDDRFYKLFSIVSRPSCYECRFTDIRRAADLTIADYWGIEKYAPELYDRRGVSLVITCTEKGAKLLDACAKSLHIQERGKHEALNEQKRLSEPLQKPEQRGAFWADYERYGLRIAQKLHSCHDAAGAQKVSPT